MTDNFGRISSTFYKLEKYNGCGYLVYEFHTTEKGKTYIKAVEEDTNHKWVTSEDSYFVSKDYGNKFYKKLKSKGFKFAGIWKMDIFGKKIKLETV